MPIERLKLPAADTRLIQYKNKIYKLKMTYDWGSGPPFLPCMPRQLHSEIEQVIRALLYVESFESLHLQTDHFQMACRSRKWPAAEMLSFVQNRTSLSTHPVMFQITVSSKEQKQPSEKSPHRKKQSVQEVSKGNETSATFLEQNHAGRGSNADAHQHNSCKQKKKTRTPSSEEEEDSRASRKVVRSEDFPYRLRVKLNARSLKLPYALRSMPQLSAERPRAEDIGYESTRIIPSSKDSGLRSGTRHHKGRMEQILPEDADVVDKHNTDSAKELRRKRTLSSRSLQVSSSASSSGSKTGTHKRLRPKIAASKSQDHREIGESIRGKNTRRDSLKRSPLVSSSSRSLRRSKGNTIKDLVGKRKASPSVARALHRMATRSSERRNRLRSVATREQPMRKRCSPRYRRRRSSFGNAIETFVNNFM